MLTEINLEVQVSSFSDTFSANFPHRSVISHIFYVNPPIFGKLYPFGVRFQHKTKQIPRNVDRFGHRNRTKPVPFWGWFHGMGSIHQNGDRLREPKVGDTRRPEAGPGSRRWVDRLCLQHREGQSSSCRRLAFTVEVCASDSSVWTSNVLRLLVGDVA